MQTDDLLVPFSLSLLNKLRVFEHESHSFKAKYLEEINELLTLIFHGKDRVEKYQNHYSETLVLAVHYYLALISNLETFIESLDSSLKLEKLNVAGINGTNIFNVHSIGRALEALRNSKHREETDSSDLQVISNFTIKISLSDKIKASKEELIIPYEMVNDLSLG
jgi:hypothetical protein